MTDRRALLTDVLWSVVALAIVAAGVVGFVTLGALREPVTAAPVERVVPPVEVVALEPWTAPLPLVGEGFLRARREVALASEVGGRVIELAPAIVARGAVRAGEVLLRVDDRSARASLERARSEIDSTRARIALSAKELERAETLRRRGVISQEELDRRRAEKDELDARLASAESALESAELALESTRVVAPFDGRVLSRSVEVGDVVAAAQPLARLFTPDRLEVDVPLEERIAALIPGLFDGERAPASVRVRFAERPFRFDARVARVARALDPVTRTLEVSVALENVGAARAAGGEAALPAGTPPALVNAWAEVTFEGRAPGTVWALPSALVREGGTLWLERAGRLEIVDIDVVHVEGGRSWIGFDERPPADARVVASLLAAPVDGMAIEAVDGGGRETRDDDGAPASAPGAARPEDEGAAKARPGESVTVDAGGVIERGAAR